MMYVCGPTVYGPAHIGNARPALVFDQLFRVLRYIYGEDHVRYARNITDIDDKIIEAASQQTVDISQITDPAIASYHNDLKALNCLPPTVEPKATESIQAMRTLIKRLIISKHAYVSKGEVFFHVPSNPHPGLANHNDLRSGGRVVVDPKKKDPRDFVLWKPAKSGEPRWSSPWGDGRPGWHIECSAMIAKEFQEQTIDIHGGGADLRFPHHEAECAQSHCAMDKPLSRYWVHNGLLTVNGEKMSKSRGNVILLSDLFEKYPAETVRYYFLRTHYRSPMDFSWEALEQAHKSLSGVYDILYRWDDINWAEDTSLTGEFTSKLFQDLNTPAAITALHALASELDSSREKAPLKAKLIKSGKLLGLLNHTPHQWRTLGVDKEAVDALVVARQEARKAKDYEEADRIRQQLSEMGITLADGVHGTEWRRT
jgi:cysteinyl-tRNA synthetase